MMSPLQYMVVGCMGLEFVGFLIFFFIFLMFIFERERESARVQVGEGQREGDTKSEAGSRLSAQSLMRDSNSRAIRSQPEPKLDA